MSEHKVRPIYPEDWARRVEAEFDEYMGRLYEYVEGDSLDEEIVDVSGEFFCGCSECDRRATWTFLMVKFIEGYRDGLISLEEEVRRDV